MKHQPALDFATIAASVDISRLVSALLGPPGASGAWTCPIGTHPDKTPSFRTFCGDDGKPRVKCLGCSWGGDALDFLVKLGLCSSPKEAAAYLVENGYAAAVPLRGTGRETRKREGTAAPNPPPVGCPSRKRAYETGPGSEWHGLLSTLVANRSKFLSGDTEGAAGAMAYLIGKSRMLTPETVRRFRLGFMEEAVWSPKIPGLLSKAGRPRGIQCDRGVLIPKLRAGSTYEAPDWGGVIVRRLTPDFRGEGPPKYKIIEGSDRGLIYPDPGLRADGRRALLLAEGEFDTMLAVQEAGGLAYGEGLAIATLGSAAPRALAPDLVARLSAFPRLILAFDADDAGQSAARFWLGAFPHAERLSLPRGKDLTEFVAASPAGSLGRLVKEALASATA